MNKASAGDPYCRQRLSAILGGDADWVEGALGG